MPSLSPTAKRCLFSAVAAAFVPLATESAQAAVITIPTPNVQSINTIPSSSPNVGTDGFEFFDFGDGASGSLATYTAANTLSPVAYATIGINSSDKYVGNSSSYAYLTIGSSDERTDDLQTSSGGSGASATFVTITVSSNASLVPMEFQLGLFGDNTATNLNNTNYTVDDVTAGTQITTTKTSTAPTDNFYYVDITGASPGDVIVISGGGQTSTATLGGVTFDTIIPAPEPASLGLLSIAGLGLLMRRRRTGIETHRRSGDFGTPHS